MPATGLLVNGVKLMAITSTEVVKEDEKGNPLETAVIIQLYQCNDQHQPIGDPKTFVDTEHTEEQYHRGLRKDAQAREQFVSKHSTDPQWNME